MDELHARVKAVRSPLELNLVKQPYSDADLADAQKQGEASVVEMPIRQMPQALALHSEPARRPVRQKQDTTTRRKAAATSQTFSFRQMRTGHQQPYMDELKRLEAQAERINQLLADRKRKQAQAEQSVEGTDQPLVEAAVVPKKKAPKRAKPSRSPQREVPPMLEQDDDTAALEAQAERIQQLLEALETALVEGEALPQSPVIAQTTIAHRSTEAAGSAHAAPTIPIAASVATSSPDRYSVDAFPAIDQIRLETTELTQQEAALAQEATETAQALRSLSSREPMQPAIAPTQLRLRRQMGRSRQQRSTVIPSRRRYGLRLRQWFQMPQTSLDRVGDAVLWIVLAIAIRVGTKFLLAHFPVLAPVLLVLMFTPAAFAVYLALYVPNAGFVSVYRLFLIMLGLLLGSRF